LAILLFWDEKVIEKIIKLISDAKDNTGGVKYLAEKMGLKYSTLYSLYSGRNNNPTIDTVGRICDYFEVSLSELSREDSCNHIFERLEPQIAKLAKCHIHKITVINNDLISELPKNSKLIFEKYTPPLKNKFHYLCETESGSVIHKKAIILNGTVYLNGEKNESPIMQLKNVEI